MGGLGASRRHRGRSSKQRRTGDFSILGLLCTVNIGSTRPSGSQSVLTGIRATQIKDMEKRQLEKRAEAASQSSFGPPSVLVKIERPHNAGVGGSDAGRQ